MNGEFPEISTEQQDLLLQIIRRSVESGVVDDLQAGKGRESSLLSRPELGGIVSVSNGLFVTIRKQVEGQWLLRGCIGLLSSVEPLAQTLPRVSRDAALRDRRFPPLTAAEIELCRFELSILTAMREVGGFQDIRIGEHGVYLKKGYHSAVFLPEVAVEQGWDLPTTLSRLSRKAGLDENAWTEKDCRFEVFSSIHFSEEL